MDWLMTVRLLLVEMYPKVTNVRFNEAYRYMDWMLTLRLLQIEILVVE